MVDNNVWMLHNEHFAPQELDKWVSEELLSQLEVILFEYLEYRAFCHIFVLEPLDNAREEEDEHFIDMLGLEQHLGHVFEFRHEFCDV